MIEIASARSSRVGGGSDEEEEEEEEEESELGDERSLTPTASSEQCEGVGKKAREGEKSLGTENQSTQLRVRHVSWTTTINAHA